MGALTQVVGLGAGAGAVVGAAAGGAGEQAASRLPAATMPARMIQARRVSRCTIRSCSPDAELSYMLGWRHDSNRPGGRQGRDLRVGNGCGD